jgi:hypothetical protein
LADFIVIKEKHQWWLKKVENCFEKLTLLTVRCKKFYYLPFLVGAMVQLGDHSLSQTLTEQQKK